MTESNCWCFYFVINVNNKIINLINFNIIVWLMSRFVNILNEIYCYLMI